MRAPRRRPQRARKTKLTAKRMARKAKLAARGSWKAKRAAKRKVRKAKLAAQRQEAKLAAQPVHRLDVNLDAYFRDERCQASENLYAECAGVMRCVGCIFVIGLV